MSELVKAIKKHKNLSLEKQKEAGRAIEGDMEKEHNNFLKKLIGLLDRKEIDTANPRSFINEEVYETMPQEWKGKTDQALVNIVHQVQMIEEFFRSKETPNSSPQLQSMIEHLWQMKQRIEDKYDAFKL